LRVVLATEGTYPFVGGGVSTWCHQLCEGLDDVSYTIFAVTGDAKSTWKYPRTASVEDVRQVALWGHDESPALLGELPFGRTLARRFRTERENLGASFRPALETILREIFMGSTPRDALLEAFVALARFCRSSDWKAAMRSETTWEAVVEALSVFAQTEAAGGETPKLTDATTCARWLYAMLTPLAVDCPRCDVFHATSAASCALPGVVGKLEHGTPLLLTEHGVYVRERYIAISQSYFSQAQKRFLIGLATAIGRAVYAAADVVSPVAAYNSRWEVPWGANTERVRVIYNGVDVERFVPGPSRKREPRPTAVVAARVFPLKDIETLVRATAVACRQVPNLVVRVFGSLDADPPYVARCRALIEELGIGEHVRLEGFHDAPAELYREGDICVLSSISEGFPYTVIESMACGVPCVATDVGGVREAIGDTGLVVPARAPEALGAAMAELLLDGPRRARLSTTARTRVVERFTIESQLMGYAGLYTELAETGRRRVTDRPETARGHDRAP
jgi:glycosyltransferase involved in cell wall biosynthesis